MATAAELCTKTLTDVAGLIKKKEVSPVELTQAMLDRISALDGKLFQFELPAGAVVEEQLN